MNHLTQQQTRLECQQKLARFELDNSFRKKVVDYAFKCTHIDLLTARLVTEIISPAFFPYIYLLLPILLPKFAEIKHVKQVMMENQKYMEKYAIRHGVDINNPEDFIGLDNGMNRSACIIS